MKRVWGNILRATPVIGVAAVILSACVHDDSSLFVRSELAQPAGSSTSGQCLWTTDPTQAFVSSGILDYSLRQQYDGVYLVGNQLVPQSNPSQLMTETSTVTIQGGVVRITKANGAQVASYTRLSSAVIPPSSGTAPTFEPVFITVLDPATLQADPDVQAIAAGTQLGFSSGYVRFVTYVKFFGVTLGGKSIESDEFEFPIDVCVGCLINFTNNTSHAFPNCAPVLNSSSSSSSVTPCYIGQDIAVPCTLVCAAFTECVNNTNNVGP